MSTEQMSQPNLELLTGRELDRRLSVAEAITQLHLVSEAVGQGLLQPHMDEFESIYQNLMPGLRHGVIVVPKSEEGIKTGSFSAFLNGKYGQRPYSYEIDCSDPDSPALLVRPRLDDYAFWDMHDPVPKYEVKNINPEHSYDIDELAARRLPMNHTQMFLRVANKAYKFARKHAV